MALFEAFSLLQFNSMWFKSMCSGANPRWYFTFTAVCCTFLQQIHLIYITIHWVAPQTTNRRIPGDFHQLKIPSFSLVREVNGLDLPCKFLGKNSIWQTASGLSVVLWTHAPMLFFLIVSKWSFQVMPIDNNPSVSDPTVGHGQITLFFSVP